MDHRDDVERLLVPNSRNAEGPQAVADAWNATLLNCDYRPPLGAKFCQLARSGDNDCDRLCICYSIGTKKMTVTQTLCMFGVLIEETRTDGAAPQTLADVRALARAVFRNAGSLDLIADNGARQLRGTARPTNSGMRDHIPWSTYFKWKCDARAVAFWLLKDDGHPRMADCGPALDANKFWFSNPTPGAAEAKAPCQQQDD